MANLPENHVTVGIEPDHYKDQYRKCEQRRTSIAQQRKRNSNDRRKAYGHANIDGNVKKDN